MKTFYDCVIHPRSQDEHDDEHCPISKNDCANCMYCKYIGTLGGEYYIQRSYDIQNENDK